MRVAEGGGHAGGGHAGGGHAGGGHAGCGHVVMGPIPIMASSTIRHLLKPVLGFKNLL